MIIRYRRRGRVQVGWAADGTAAWLSDDLCGLLRLSVAELRRRIDDRATERVSVDEVEVLAPIDGLTEVWAAGVTYETSQEARIEESETSADVYAKIYDADRPELFFKSVAWRVVGDGAPIRARADSTIDVPEPELALLINAPP